MQRRFCLRGHDTLIVGRTSSRWCRQCSRDADNSDAGRLAARARRKRYRKTAKGRLNHLLNQIKYNSTDAGRSTIERKNTKSWQKRLEKAIVGKEALIEELEAMLNGC